MKKILLVDDTATVLLSEKMMLGGEGYDLRTAYNGKEALAKIDEDPPDLVLCDMLMPEVDGLELCRRVKANPKTKHVKVIIISTQSRANQQQDVVNAGADGYLTKPVSKANLLAAVRGQLD
jgi:CheY-like chemotaxis protein